MGATFLHVNSVNLLIVYWTLVSLLSHSLLSTIAVVYFVDVGETVLTSPQCLARVVSLPQPDIALVLLEMIPGTWVLLGHSAYHSVHQ